MYISLYEFFLILIIGQCTFLIFAIQYIPNKNSGTNRIIQYLLGIYSFFLIERIMGSELGHFGIFKYRYLFNVFYLFIGPFVYTYVRRLLFYESAKYRLPYYHYFPIVFYLIYGVFHVYFYDSIKNKSNYNWILFLIVEISFFISITAYIIKSYILFKYYKKNEIKELSFNPNSIKYISVSLFCLALYMFFWLLGIFELFDLITIMDRALIYDISCIIFGIQIYVVSFYNLKYPEIFKIPYPSNQQIKSKRKNPINEKEIVKIKNSLIKFFDDDKGYRRPELSLTILANEINTTTNKLSWVLNNAYKKSFYELVNEYRVDEFSKRVNENNHKEFTLISIAYEVGFNSKSTFYKAFKEIVKITPKEYIKKIDNSKKTDKKE